MDYVVGMNLLVCRQTEELKEKNAIISKLNLRLESTMKHLEEAKKLNKILQENISKIFNSAKIESDIKNYKIYELQRQLDKYLPKHKSINKSNRKNPEDKLSARKLEDNREPVGKKPRIEKDRQRDKPQCRRSTSRSRHRRSLSRSRRSSSRTRTRRSRSRSKPKERRRELTSQDLRHHLRNYDRVKPKYFPESSKNKEKFLEDFNTETRKLLDRIRKNQTNGSPTSSEHSGTKKRDFIKELGDKINLTVENTETAVKNENVCQEKENKYCIDLHGPESEEHSGSFQELHTDNEKDNNSKINLLDEMEQISTEENCFTDSKNTDETDELSGNSTLVLDEGEISNDIFDELTQILNEIHEDESQTQREEHDESKYNIENTENDNQICSIPATSEIVIEEGEISSKQEVSNKENVVLKHTELTKNKNLQSTSTLSDISAEEDSTKGKKETKLKSKRKIILEQSNNNSIRELKVTIKNKEHKHRSKRKLHSRRSSNDSSNRKSKKSGKAIVYHLESRSISSIDNKYEKRMKFEDPFNTKDWRTDPLTYVPRKWKDMRIYDELPYVDEGKTKDKTNYDVETIESNFDVTQYGGFSPDCPF